jgi:hypothetical protein
MQHLADSRDFTRESALFQEKGFTRVKGLFNPDDLQSHLEAVRRVMDEGGVVGFKNPWINGSKEFKIAAAQLRTHPDAATLMNSAALKAAAVALLNVNPKRVCVLVDKIFEKESGDAGTHWHTDAGATEVKNGVEALTAWIPFQDTSPRNGLLRFGVGTHTTSHGMSGENSVRFVVEDLGFLALGDVSFHHIRTHHGSHPNLSDQTREAVTLIFAAIPSLLHDDDMAAAAEVDAICSPHWECPFALYGEAVPRTKDLCRECDPYFPLNEFHQRQPESRPAGWLGRCADEIVAGCADVFALSLEGLPENAIVWLEGARKECANLRAWDYDPSRPEKEPIPHHRHLVHEHLTHTTRPSAGFWRYDMILGEGDLDKDKALSLTEFLRLPFIHSETFEHILSYMRADAVNSTPDTTVGAATDARAFTHSNKLTEMFLRHDLDDNEILTVDEFKGMPFFALPNAEKRIGRKETTSEPDDDASQNFSSNSSTSEHYERHADDTTVDYVGSEKNPVAVLENVLPTQTFTTLRDFLRNRTDFFEGDANAVAFPGKIAKLDRAIIDSILDALLADKKLATAFPHEIFQEREYVRGFASILCSSGWVHNDLIDAKYQGVAPPAAVLYFGYGDDMDGSIDGSKPATRSRVRATGTAFYREIDTGFETTSRLELRNATKQAAFCQDHPKSVGCLRLNPAEHNARFEEIKRVEARPNRMVLYPHDLFHNAFAEERGAGAGVGLGDRSATHTDILPCSVQRGRMAISIFFLVPSGSESIRIVDGLEAHQNSLWKSRATRVLEGYYATNNISDTRPEPTGPIYDPKPNPIRYIDESHGSFSGDGTDQQLSEPSELVVVRRPYPYGIFDMKRLGNIRHESPIKPMTTPRSELCCAQNFSAVWDRRGKLIAAVIDQFFCDEEYRRVQDSMLDPQQWLWEDALTGTQRMQQAWDDVGSQPHDSVSNSPSLLGNAVDMAKERQLHENIKTCLRQTLPTDVLRSTKLLVYRGGHGAIAHVDPEDMSPAQSAPRVGTFEFVSEYTVTPDRRFERAGTVFVEQKGTGVFRVRTEAQRKAFYAANREIQRIAVEEEGKSYASGWMNMSETRWALGMFMVPNRANRIVFYPHGRPHNDFIPERDLLSPTAENGRTLLKSFWATKREEK